MVLGMQVVLDENENLDFSKFSFEEFERFFFDRPVLKKKYFEEEFCPGIFSYASSDPEKTVELLDRTMSDFKRIGGRYSLGQINQGVWALFGARIEIQEHLWNKNVPLDARKKCIRAMVVPYRDFVCGHPAKVMENCFQMWWDLIAVRGRVITEDASAIVETMFETLCAILSLPDLRCQFYALHGLGHVRDPRVKSEVQKYIDRHRSEFDPETIVWIEKCRDGTVM